MDDDQIPFKFLWESSDAGLETAELRYARDVSELSKQIRETERELNALHAERQRLSDARATISWFRRHRPELRVSVNPSKVA